MKTRQQVRSEQVKPRAYWERKLAALLAPILSEPSRSYPWRKTYPIAPYPVIEGDFKVLEVHVFGSFARGATECGDLDLLVVVDGRLPTDEIA